jgi:hypothetical protein
MDIERLIMDTFSDHEHVAPDSDVVYAAARERIDRRRGVLSRPLAVAAGVAVLTLAAVTVVALNRPDSGPGPAPADRAQVAAPPLRTAPAVADLTMPFSLGWVPEGETEYLVHRINTGATAEEPDVPLFGGEYMLTVTNGDQVLYIDVQHMGSGSADGEPFKSGPSAPITINGQPGIESSVPDGPGGYEVYVKNPAGGAMYVNVSAHHGSPAVPAQQLVETGRRIAENIRFPGATTVTPAFGLGDLPNGTRMCAFDVEKPFESSAPSSGVGSQTSYELGTCDTMPTIHVSSGGRDESGSKPGQPVQGHETRYTDEDGYLTVWVLGAVDDKPVTLAGSVPLADLYTIANGLVLPN